MTIEALRQAYIVRGAHPIKLLLLTQGKVYLGSYSKEAKLVTRSKSEENA